MKLGRIVAARAWVLMGGVLCPGAALVMGNLPSIRIRTVSIGKREMCRLYSHATEGHSRHDIGAFETIEHWERYAWNFQTYLSRQIFLKAHVMAALRSLYNASRLWYGEATLQGRETSRLAGAPTSSATSRDHVTAHAFAMTSGRNTSDIQSNFITLRTIKFEVRNFVWRTFPEAVFLFMALAYHAEPYR